MISNVLGRGKGFPVGSKMPGAFDTVEAMLRAFVRDYKPRSNTPEHGKTADPDLMLIVFTDKELDHLKTEMDTKFNCTAVERMAAKLNTIFSFGCGFKRVIFETTGDKSTYNGLMYCPEDMEWPENDSYPLETGPTMNENREPTSYRILIG